MPYFPNLCRTAAYFASYPAELSDSAYEVSSTVAESIIPFESRTYLEELDIQNGVFPKHPLLKILPSLKRLCMSLSLGDLRALTPDAGNMLLCFLLEEMSLTYLSQDYYCMEDSRRLQVHECGEGGKPEALLLWRMVRI